MSDRTYGASDVVVTTTGQQTLTGKTLGNPIISAISNSGLLTLPTVTGTVWAGGNVNSNAVQPAFYAYKASTSTNQTGDNTSAAVVFDTEVRDQGSIYNNSTGVCTLNQTGMWLLSVRVLFASLGALFTNGFVYIGESAGSQTYYGVNMGNIGVSASAGGNYQGNLDVLGYWSSGDTFTVYVQVAGSTKTIGVFGDGTYRSTAFSGFFLG